MGVSLTKTIQLLGYLHGELETPILENQFVFQCMTSTGPIKTWDDDSRWVNHPLDMTYLPQLQGICLLRWDRLENLPQEKGHQQQKTQI